ncbi:S8 family peptidase [Roseisolibacter agri]|uniref:Peptidase S8/S53 domain-containing protein n=1 Tax=Roseisolibacter agri TaxID=2014610 RepID=A0AA37QEC1_9BACT|nr:S8 family peptidase [Roseisolibacter agri]GLC28246.1 hypothetical protein rosag_47590 [Roseisolibacter agri]
MPDRQRPDRPERLNFLLGFGERLVEPIAAPRSVPTKRHPYTFAEARARLAPQAQAAARALDALPERLCPGDEAVALLTLHPAYIAKSFYPSRLLRSAGLDPLGGRARTITPERHTRAGAAAPETTSELFVAGPRVHFRALARALGEWTEDTPGADDLVKIEEIRVQPAAERVQPLRSAADMPLLEVVVHARAGGDGDGILQAFTRFLAGLDAQPQLDERLYAEGLCFLPVRVPRVNVPAVADFTFVRVIREMPTLRRIDVSGVAPADRDGPDGDGPNGTGRGGARGAVRGSGVPPRGAARGGTPRGTSGGSAARAGARPLVGPVPELPAAPAHDSGVQVAVFDGGVPARGPLARWVREVVPPGTAEPAPDLVRHGLGVTSALLFGSLRPGEAAAVPFATVDHVRVLDVHTAQDNQTQFFPVLRRIRDTLLARDYQFINLSLGPDLPVDDNEVHAWTAVLDPLFAAKEILATVAAGNNGTLDRAAGLARICPPADAVNALTVGACGSTTPQWARAPYSSVGPGRRPGVVKPDVLAFGGSAEEPFYLLAPGAQVGASALHADAGTSYAAPLALRTALGMRALFGPVLRPVAIKALLVHAAEPVCADPTLEQRAECGWGRLPAVLDEFVLCDDHTARVVYQGQLEPGSWVRMRIPVPAPPIAGLVTVSATFCFAAATDPHDPVNYTRSGLEVRFRPDADRREDEQQRDADTEPFFQPRAFYLSERELRRDAHKWETTLHRTRRLRGTRLRDPVFDVHYNARVGGRNAPSLSRNIPYALVITVRAPSEPRFYDRVRQRYRTVLEPLRPVTQIPLRLGA